MLCQEEPEGSRLGTDLEAEALSSNSGVDADQIVADETSDLNERAIHSRRPARRFRRASPVAP